MPPALPAGLALALAAASLLGGCMSEAELRAAEEAQMAADRQECAGLGFEPDTEPFAECLLKLREIRAMEGTGMGVSLGVGFGF